MTTGASARALPAPSRPSGLDRGLVIFTAIAIVLAIGAGAVSLAPGKLQAPLEALLVLVAGAVLVRTLGARVGLVALLIAACMINRFTYSLGSFDVRSEQVAAGLGLVYIGYQLMTRRGELSLLRPNLAELLLGAWFLLNLISSVTAAPEKSRSVKAVALLVVGSLGLLLPRRLVIGQAAREAIDPIIKMLLVAIAAEGTYGVAAWLAHVFGSTVSISPNQATGHLIAYGTLWEPNVFGAVCAAGAIAWAWLGPRYFRFAWLGLALCLAGTLVSFTRAAWAAVAVMLAVSFFGQLRERANTRQIVIGCLAAGAFAVAAFAAEKTTDYYVVVQVTGTNGQPHQLQPTRGFFSNLGNAIDVLGRLDQIKIGGNDIKKHVLLGNGTASYGERHLVAGQPEHIANLELAVLYDTGVVGLLMFLGFVVAVGYAAWRRRGDPYVAGLGMAAIVIFIANAATETTELMFTWLIVGLVLMAVDVADQESSNRDRSSGRLAHPDQA